MNIFHPKGKILRIRPGHLANFSGGAGYMPFVIFYSVPASILFNIVSSLILHFRGKHLLSGDEDTRTALHVFARYAHRHTAVCIVIAAIAGIIFFFIGQSMVYGDKVKYAFQTVVYATGPLAAWILSSIALMLLMFSRGAKATNLLISAAIYIALLFACIPLLKLVFAITGT